MLKRFNTRQLVFMALMGAVFFLMDFLVSTAVDAATGVPGAGYAVVSVLFIALATLAGLILEKFGMITIMALIYAIIAIPTPVYGPPGLFKVAMAVATGLIMDLIIAGFSFRKIGFYLGMAIGNMASVLLYVWTGRLLGLPGTEALVASMWLFTVIYGIEAVPGVWIGYFVHNRIKHKPIVRQIRG